MTWPAGRVVTAVFYDAARGRWVGVIDLGRDPETRRRVRRKVSAPTSDECRDKLDELREEKRKTGTVARRDVTVGQVVDDWLANPPRRPGRRSPGAATGTRRRGSRSG